MRTSSNHDDRQDAASVGQLIRTTRADGAGVLPAFTAAVAALLLVAGCSLKSKADLKPDPAEWVHETKADSAFAREADICHQEAVEYHSDAPFADLIRERQAQCLEDRFGWMPADSASES